MFKLLAVGRKENLHFFCCYFLQLCIQSSFSYFLFYGVFYDAITVAA